MNASTTPAASTSDDQATGYKVMGYALNLLTWGTVIAVTWSCSTILMGIVMFIIMSIVMSLLSYLLGMVIFLKVDVSTVESLGRTVTSATTRVRGMFTRSAPVAA